ncbi:MoaD/ThiS family protein [Leadbetterella byssophila]|uniref:MoaD/ThiS family protein n=1 Tax=Leadbetterella byssophila TaxID=316068 RepID=UPI00399F8BFE
MEGVKVLFFGEFLEWFGKERYVRVKDTYTLKVLLDKEKEEFACRNVSFAVNQQVIHGNIQLEAGDVVAVMPPFSGG